MFKTSKMKKINLFLIAVLMGFTVNCFSQEEVQPEAEIVRPFHLSFITPVSTNGMQSGEVTNIFSLNLFAGYSGGLHGFELGGFANIIKGDTKGLQIAGFSNTNRRNVSGCQIAGFSNVGLGTVNGAQIAGFANVVKDSIQAVQIAGFSNVSAGMNMGGQFAGFSNVSVGVANGIQVAGFMNVAKDSIHALQVAGFTNVAQGMPLGGQVSGFANVNHGDANGMQIAGFSNVTTGDITGLQVSGFLNKAKKVNGVQIGVINIADTIENGVGIGVLTIVKNGYRTFEISGNETFSANVSFKTGTERLYNIITLGANTRKNQITWGWGFGFGTILPVSEKLKLNVDAISYHVNEDVWFTNRLNLLNKLNVTAEYKIGNFLTVYGGPTWNVHVSHVYYVEGVQTTTSLVGWSTFDRTRNRTNVKMYPGFTVGVRL